jgi:hypothetical protein
MTVDWLGNEGAREVLANAVRPVLVDWGFDEQTVKALVDVFVAILRNGYNLQALEEMLVQIELNLDDLDDTEAKP